MSNVRWFFIIIFSLSLVNIFAGGSEEAIERPVSNGEWVLCVTSFDVSSLPLSQRNIGDIIVRELVNSLNTVEHRNRIKVSPEYAWYEGYAWAQSRNAAAKALEAKRNERDLLLFKGDAAWRYRQNLKTLEADIEKLEEELWKAMARQPLVAEEPSFKFTEENNKGTFPNPPAVDGEYQFCKNQKADAFLTGSVSEYHGRIFINLRLFTLYTNSYVYEDSIIFSSDDINIAVDEISGRLVAVISGENPAEIAIHTVAVETTGQDSPSASSADALVLINNSFAGRGEVSRREYPPGKVTVEIFSENYETAQVETDLKSGEFTEITANLRPINLVPINISVPGQTGVSVYRGSLYVGEAPLTLQLPADSQEYLFAETLGGQTSRVVLLVNEPIPSIGSPRRPVGSLSKKSTLDGENNLLLQTRVPPPAGQDRVNKARRQYYWAWGGTWIAGIAAWILYGSYNGKANAYNYQPISMDMYNKTIEGYYWSIGSAILVGAAVVVESVMMGRYIYTAGDDAASIVK
ncbi:hypothetical protein AGMMS49579_03490 [Spirochaetia bacterium]|nr:hypothetical protein AGMMS49579_03490 [Spirochaetia bacterium]